MDAESFARIDMSTVPPRVTIPRDYNASFDFIERHVIEGRGDKVAIIDDTESVTYADFAGRVRRAAAALRALGIAQEQRIALCLLDTVDLPVLFWGAIRAGIVPVPLNTMLMGPDYVQLLRDCRATALFVSDALFPRFADAIEASPHLKQTVVVPSPSGGDAGGYPHWRPLLDAARRGDDSVAPTTSDDVAFWLYSSGSTGAPKGVMHLHSHLVWTAALYGRSILGIREDDVIYSAARLFFAYGLGNAMTFPFSVGATALLQSERPTAAVVMRLLRTRQPTLFAGVPTLFAAILADENASRATGSPRLRASISAGEALPRHVGERWRERFGTDILDGIGSTELLHIFISNRHGDVEYGTSGRPVPGYDLKVVGEDGEPVGDGEEGSLWVRGPSSAIGYWNSRERTLATFHGPWTRTGDRYIRTAEGRYIYSGRADDMLKVGGIWVSPFEVESAVASHPAVLEAAVVGNADEEGLIKPKAFVVLKTPSNASQALADEIKAHVKTRLAAYKYPRWVEFVDELPKTATGKIQRFRLRT